MNVPADVGACVAGLRARLAAAGIPSAGLEARLLVGRAMGWSPEQVLARSGQAVDAARAREIEAMAQRRLAREPLAYILGSREFWSRDFAVSPAVLVPRPESETLIEAAIRFFPDRAAALRIADLGTGSGCLLVTLLALWPRAEGVGVDLSQDALAIAEMNARAHGVAGRCRLIHGDWRALTGRFDLIVANPPYIPSGDIAALEPEVAQFEPRLALDGGRDGLDAYRTIAGQLDGRLKPGGRVALEVGAGQAPAVGELLKAANMQNIVNFQDLAGIDRVVTATQGTRI